MYFDISTELEDIIVKYNIDSGFPEFRKYREAVGLIEKTSSNYSKGDEVLLVASSLTDYKFVRADIHSEADFVKFIIDDINLDTLDFGVYADIVTVSYFVN